MPTDNNSVYTVNYDGFSGAITPLIEAGFLQGPVSARLPLNDPAAWDKIATACTEYLAGAGRGTWQTEALRENIAILALKLTAEAAIAWRASSRAAVK